MKTVPCSQFADCSAQDFSHYFNNTALLVDLSSHRQRVFLPTSIAQDKIKGTYLTRAGELQELSIDFASASRCLHAILHESMTFRLTPKCVAFWKAEWARNMKKSIVWNFRGFTFMGLHDASDVSANKLTAAAFSEVYGKSPQLSGINEFFNTLQDNPKEHAADMFLRNFVITKDTEKSHLWHKGKVLGTVKFDHGLPTLQLPRWASPYKRYLSKIEGVNEDQIKC